VTVRTRSGYVEPTSARAAAKANALPAAPVWTALAAPTPQGDLPLQMVAASQDAFAGLLHIAPTTVRDFLSTDRVTVFARIAQGGKDTLASTTVSGDN
jgi:hypothetical protein